MLGKLMASTKGREKLLGATKRNAMIGFVAGGLSIAGGIPMAIFGDPPHDSCANMKDAWAETCAGHITDDSGNTYDWTVTKPGAYTIEVVQPGVKIPIYPVLTVRTAAGADVAKVGDTASVAVTHTFAAGTYKINVRDSVRGAPAKFKGGFSFSLKFGAGPSEAPPPEASGAPSAAPSEVASAAAPSRLRRAPSTRHRTRRRPPRASPPPLPARRRPRRASASSDRRTDPRDARPGGSSPGREFERPARARGVRGPVADVRLQRRPAPERHHVAHVLRPAGRVALGSTSTTSSSPGSPSGAKIRDVSRPSSNDIPAMNRPVGRRSEMTRRCRLAPFRASRPRSATSSGAPRYHWHSFGPGKDAWWLGAEASSVTAGPAQLVLTKPGASLQRPFSQGPKNTAIGVQ